MTFVAVMDPFGDGIAVTTEMYREMRDKAAAVPDLLARLAAAEAARRDAEETLTILRLWAKQGRDSATLWYLLGYKASVKEMAEVLARRAAEQGAQNAEAVAGGDVTP